MKGWRTTRGAILATVALPAVSMLLLAAKSIDSPDPSWRAFVASFDHGDASATNIPPSQLVNGRRGKALRLNAQEGHAEFVREGIVDLSRPGTITCWIRPDSWRSPAPDTGYLPFLRVTGRGSSLLLIERDRRFPGRTTDVWIAGIFSRPSRSDVEIQHELRSLWADDAWHFIALQWDATGFALQIDDSGPIRIAVPRKTFLTAFSKDDSRLIVSAGVDEGVLVDDLTVWSRPLTRAELESIRTD